MNADNIEMKKSILFIIFFVTGAAAGMLLPRFCPFLRPQAEVVTKTDTLAVRDTIREIRPVYVEKTRTDTMLVAVRDTIRLRDTLFVTIDREQRHYRGDDYDAWVSGWRPALDSIRVYPETRYITTESIFVEPRKCSSLALEASASWCGTASLLLSLEYTHEWRRWYAGASAGYDVVTGSPYVGARIGLPLWRW